MDSTEKKAPLPLALRKINLASRLWAALGWAPGNGALKAERGGWEDIPQEDQTDWTCSGQLRQQEWSRRQNRQGLILPESRFFLRCKQAGDE